MRMFVGDKCSSMVGSIAEVFPDAKYQRCTVHFYRNVNAKIPKNKRKVLSAMLKAIHAQESFEASTQKAESVSAKLEEMKLKAAAKVVREGYLETLTYTSFPMEHWKRIRINNAIERLNKEIMFLSRTNFHWWHSTFSCRAKKIFSYGIGMRLAFLSVIQLSCL